MLYLPKVTPRIFIITNTTKHYTVFLKNVKGFYVVKDEILIGNSSLSLVQFIFSSNTEKSPPN
ncbi:hypothetical protein CRE19_07055 [Listeria monocytogenes]|nr:hypothetical protein [Listeria monocytogenes]